LRNDARCAAPVPVRIDPLATLQRRRIALQHVPRSWACIGMWAGWSIAKLRSQVVERDEGRPRIIVTLRRLFFERGAGRRMARTFVDGALRRPCPRPARSPSNAR
jgi:hypothetical protein